ncbi:helix-turn-helix domain-containing protein [Carboxydothermus pertinax]|uniref:Helix-turn-helix domain-containing protein n=1 Tax=Carboxydothermus pertinax TaxID=870242 RepID=A0A1L8CW22_9THEO|nr:helix-turn-helix domain-containing protein [Carboxydothermus pertinax]GAV23110.1 helix-turn-helix domain-containing protein [Carboxydothermus pertinax]
MIGEKLKSRREQLGLSLKDVENEIKIRSKYLQALEEEKFDELPGKAYVKPFLKSYARFLGVEIAEEDLPLSPEKTEPQGILLPPNVSESRKNKTSFPLALFIVLLAFGVLLSGIYLALSSKKTNKELIPPPKSSVTPKVYKKPSKQVPQVVSNKKTVTVAAVYGPCWLEVKEDNQVLFSGKINPPEQKQFASNKTLTIKYGNAGAVIVTVNGVTYGAPGKKGQVVKIKY